MNMENRGLIFNRLVTIINELREKCPWDKKQTIQSLRQLTIEETYELADAITSENWKNIKEELGDLLLHIVFYAKIGEEQNQFTLDDVINGICEKLIFRHPHIYSDTKVINEEEVKKNWEKLKLKEGNKTLLSGVPKSLPSIVKAMRLQEKAKQVGFDFENKDQVWKKVIEEVSELKEAILNKKLKLKNEIDKSKLQNNIEEEFGDLIFSLINYARFLEIDADNALELTNKKFMYRFNKMEELAKENNQQLFDLNLQQMDAMWNEIKKQKN